MKLINYLLLVLIFGCTQSQQHSKSEGHHYDEIIESKSAPIKWNSGPNYKELPFSFSATNPTELELMTQEEVYYINDLQLTPYVKLPKSKNFKPEIALAAADVYLPVLITHDKHGNPIDYEVLSSGNCGADCGYRCSEHLIIDKDWNISIIDTIWKMDCINGYQDSTTLKIQTETIFGSVDSFGNISLKKPKLKEL